MKIKIEVDEKSLIEDYTTNGFGIYDICEKYHIGKLKVKKILADNGVELRKKGAQATIDRASFKVKDFKIEKYPHVDGHHYVAIDKQNGMKIEDYMNQGGHLTTHIRKVYGVETPTLYDRRMYYMKSGDYWWEQWFDIVLIEDNPTKKCPYCNWSTEDIENKSGMLLTHLKKTHGISIEKYLEEFPQDKPLFKTQTITLEKRKHIESDKKNYVICPLCNKKMGRLTKSHMEIYHNMDLEEFKSKFPNIPILSEEQRQQASDAFKQAQLVPRKNFRSKPEMEIADFISNLGLECENNRQYLCGKEIDIYVPSKHIGIEFDGLKHHTEFFGKKRHNYHLEKTLLCNEQGVGLIHVFEDEYMNHKDIVLNKIKHILGMDTNLPKIAGRKITLKEIYSSEANEFLAQYHIQGFVSSSVYLGAFFNEELIAVMSFKNGNIKNKNWELTRFATKPTYIYQGIASKMFKYFIRTYEPEIVVSFADRRWTLWQDNNLYTKMGFQLEKTTAPDYRYYNERAIGGRYRRVHKMTMCKSVLHKKFGFPMTMTELEMAKELGYDRIWDCGLFKFVWKK